MRWRQDYDLFLIGAVAFTAATIGYQHRRRHRPGDTGHIAGMGIAYVATLTAFYVDNGPHLPPVGPAARSQLLAAPLRHRRADHHPRDNPRPGPARPDTLILDLGSQAVHQRHMIDFVET
jgi:hypothetical protein